jgi:phosphatidylglycerophosphatase C
MKKGLALFDFDKTIISHDTGLEFIVYALKRNPIRFTLALIVAPLAFVFFIRNKYRFVGNSIFLWLGTIGLSKRKIIKLRRQFVDSYLQRSDVSIFPAAVDKIRSHQVKDEQVVIVSGASVWMIKKILNRMALDNILVVGSKETFFLKGMIAKEHCFSNNKLPMLKRQVDVSGYDEVFGYTDSFSDAPLLTLCSRKSLINPSLRHYQKFKKAFDSEFDILSWR